MRSRWALRWASTSLSQLADGMTYYSCPDFSKPDRFLHNTFVRNDLRAKPVRFLICGPRGIRTPDLLNAIETRSQLRYRPINKANDILLEAKGDVKQLL